MSLEPTFDTVKLELQKYVAEVWINKGFFAIEPEADLHSYAMIDDLVMSLSQKVASQPLEEISCRYPADWREAVKERFLPERLKRRWPVQFVEERLVAFVLYPKIALPKEQHYLHMVKQRDYPEILLAAQKGEP